MNHGKIHYFWPILNNIQATPLLPKRIRTKILRFFGCKIDLTVRIAEQVYIGSNKLVICNNASINIGVFLDGSTEIFIGEYVRLGPFVRVLTGTHVYAQSVLRRGPKSTDLNLPVRIERGCWLGIGSTVMPGVTIAEGCVIGAGALVMKSTEPNGLYAGVPAVRIKDLSVEEDAVDFGMA